MRWLCFRLRAPLAAFGSETIDAYGVTADFPTQSMLTGLFANALGWDRSMRQEHQALQDRLIYGAVREHEPALGRMTDYQTAKLGHDDRSWTTRGKPAGRAGGIGTYQGSHQRYRDYHADLRVTGAVRLEPAEQAPTLDDLAEALTHPARPLFIGRKPCLPAAPIFGGDDWVFEAPDIRAALAKALSLQDLSEGHEAMRALWPASGKEEREAKDTETVDQYSIRINERKWVTDERNWVTGLHGGARRVCLGSITLQGAEE